MRSAVLLIGCLGLSSVALAQPVSERREAEPGVTGRWWTQNRDGVVEIQRCASGLCGFVIGITEFHPDGTPPLDNKGRTRCKLQIISDGTEQPSGAWDSHITDPDDGKQYTITLRLDAQGRLRMRGYIGIPLFGRTELWTRFTGRTTPDCHID